MQIARFDRPSNLISCRFLLLLMKKNLAAGLSVFTLDRFSNHVCTFVFSVQLFWKRCIHKILQWWAWKICKFELFWTRLWEKYNQVGRKYIYFANWLQICFDVLSAKIVVSWICFGEKCHAMSLRLIECLCLVDDLHNTFLYRYILTENAFALK